MAGAAMAAILGIVAVRLRADQILTGTAVTLAAIGLTGLLTPSLLGTANAALGVPTLAPAAVPGLAAIPGVGPILFNQSPLTYLTYLLIPVACWLLLATRFGLELRAAGESPAAATAAGVRVVPVRIIGTVVGGAFAGLAGASLVLAQVGGFTERMTAGRGFIAIAIVVLGRWHPAGAALAAIGFGAATALQFLIQAQGVAIPYQFLLALPYVLALAVLANRRARSRAPAALARE
jgi:simple sugar transport system permease protein